MQLHRPLALALTRAARPLGSRVHALPLTQTVRRPLAEKPASASEARPPLSLRCLGGGPAPPGTTLRVSFNDPEAYERIIGPWSHDVSLAFLKWLAIAAGLRWLDVGCGSGVSTRVIAEHCRPATVHGIDPEPSQIEHARRSSQAIPVAFRVGSATDLPYPPASFDVAVMALVLPHLDDPALAVAQMIRVLAPGGLACAYNWDVSGGGAPVAPLSLAMQQVGVPMPPAAPNEALTSHEAVAKLWRQAGLRDVKTHSIEVQRVFPSLAHAWQAMQWGARSAALRGASPVQREEVRALFSQNLLQDTSGPVVCRARAIAVQGQTCS